MNRNIYLATNEYQNEASTQAQSCGGLVLILGSSAISIGNEHENIWTYKATVWHQIEEDVMTRSYSDVENDLLRTGAVTNKGILINVLPFGVYAAILPNVNYYMSETEILSCTAEILRTYGNYVITMSSSTNVNGNTVASQNEQGATSAVVKGIEKELGIDLDVNSDSELHSILRKNGAEPLSGLLKMAYGMEKKKTETKR
ncbi:MAG: hypothetical protein Q8Q22_00420 [bacterium]|nr:hypothetical protein [bacterium]